MVIFTPRGGCLSETHHVRAFLFNSCKETQTKVKTTTILLSLINDKSLQEIQEILVFFNTLEVFYSFGRNKNIIYTGKKTSKLYLLKKTKHHHHYAVIYISTAGL